MLACELLVSGGILPATSRISLHHSNYNSKYNFFFLVVKYEFIYNRANSATQVVYTHRLQKVYHFPSQT